MNNNKKLILLNIKEILINEGFFDFIEGDRIGLYGSFVRDEEYNDIDILVEKPLNIIELYKFKSKMMRKYKLKFDIMIKEYADPIILRNAMKDLVYVEK